MVTKTEIMKKPWIYIIGAGVGGLSTAIVLRSKGYQVVIYEKNPFSGGKMNTYTEKGFIFDIGPHIITLPQIIEDLFKTVSKSMNNYFELIPINPINKYIFDKSDYAYSNTKFSTDYSSSDFENELEFVNKFFMQDTEKYKKFLSLSKKYYELSNSQFLKYKEKSNLNKVKDFLKLILLSFYLPFESVDSKLNKYISSKELKDIYKSFGFYVGADSKHLASLYLMLGYLEKEFGVYYVKGGIHNIAQGLEKLALELGVEINYNTEVKSIYGSNNKIEKITTQELKGKKKDRETCLISLENGILISNADFGFTHSLIESRQKIILNKAQKEIKSYYSLPQSTSAFIVLLGLNKKIDCLSHHSTFLSKDLDKEYEEIFEKNSLQQDPTLGIDIITKSDDTVAPEGCESLFIMASPPSLSNIDWKAIKDSYAELIIKKIETRLNISIKDNIIVKKIITPQDIEKMYNQPYGSIYGQGVWGMKGLLTRKKNKSTIFDNLYFVGGSVQPGGGVPMVISSGMTVARIIDKKYKKFV